VSGESKFGKGSTFSFNVKLFPMDQDAAAVRSVQIPEGEQFAKSYPVSILIAEDNRINRRLLETLMERLGYEATFAFDGTSVMTEVSKRSFDLILMDLQMPLMGGIETTRRIRSGEAGKAVKSARIVAITAFISEENLQASKEVGMDALLAKPFDISKIKMEIIRAYEGKMMHKSDAK
jgi:CheY-like chemotaxis protein